MNNHPEPDALHLSWMRYDEGVITIYATDGAGKKVAVADCWAGPMRQYMGIPDPLAKGIQQQLAETLVQNWNKPDTSAEVRARLHDDMRFRLSAAVGSLIEKTQRKQRACEALESDIEDHDPHVANIYGAEAGCHRDHLADLKAAFDAGRALPDERAVFEAFQAATGNMPTEVVAWAAGIVHEALWRADAQSRYAVPLAAADAHPGRWLGQTFKLLEGIAAMKGTTHD